MRAMFVFLNLILTASLAIASDSFEVNGINYQKTSETEVKVVSGGNYTGNITIPSSVTYADISYSITSIGEMAFSECNQLHSITIPEPVKSIGNSAFQNCTGLEYIQIPSTVTVIGSFSSPAFYGCSALKSIEVNASNQNFSSENGILFNKDKSILIRYPAGISGPYTIPSTVSTISKIAFQYCSGLSSISLPSSVSSIESGAFDYCTNLTNINIPTNVYSIGGTFRNCTKLISITVDEANAQYCSTDGVLFNKSKTELIKYPCAKSGGYNIPSTVNIIKNAAFGACAELSEVSIPESVQYIEAEAFTNCTKLTSITIPPAVTTIEYGTFENCSNLSGVIIPSQVTKIYHAAFKNCAAMSSITVQASTPPNVMFSSVFEKINKTIPVYVPAGSVQLYRSAVYWKDFSNIIEKASEIEIVGENNFKYYITGNQIQLFGIEGRSVTVYDAAGKIVYKQPKAKNSECIHTSHKSLYIIAIDNYIKKISL